MLIHLIPQIKSVMYVDDFVEKYLDCNINFLAFEKELFDLHKCELWGKCESALPDDMTMMMVQTQRFKIEIIRALFATNEMDGQFTSSKYLSQ
jgi:hypothetical protein